MSEISVLFVCLGNICRSPTAHGIFEGIVQREGLQARIRVDSAGTGDWHLGEQPDRRAMQHASKRGYDISSLRARKVIAEDFRNFHYLLAMDNDNFRQLKLLKPPEFEGHLGLFLDFSSQQEYREVPDPYYGGSGGFELVLDLVEDASQGLLNHIREHHL